MPRGRHTFSFGSLFGWLLDVAARVTNRLQDEHELVPVAEVDHEIQTTASDEHELLTVAAVDMELVL